MRNEGGAKASKGSPEKYWYQDLSPSKVKELKLSPAPPPPPPGLSIVKSLTTPQRVASQESFAPPAAEAHPEDEDQDLRHLRDGGCKGTGA